jgi:hypothetical protein
VTDITESKTAEEKIQQMPVHTLREESLCHSRRLDAKPIRMEMNHNAGVNSDRFHRLGVGVGCTSTTLKELGHAWKQVDFSTARYVLNMTQGRVLCRGQAGKVGIVWVHVDWSSQTRVRSV